MSKRKGTPQLIEGPIDVYRDTEYNYVWSANGVYTLRSKYRIVGKSVGTMGTFPEQNMFLSLPLQLMDAEVTLGLEKGFLRVLEGNCPLPTTEHIAHAESRQNDILEKQRAEFITTRLNSFVKIRTKQRAEAQPNVTSTGTRDPMEVRPEAETEMVDTFEDDITVAVNNAIRQLAQEERDALLEKDIARVREEAIACITPSIGTNETQRDVAATLLKWEYPSTHSERIRYAVFKDVWEKGNYITGGGKFGGDFLVYDGDPMLVHAGQVVRVVEWDTLFRGIDIVSMGRLGTTVKKTFVLASQDPHNSSVKYVSMTWEARVIEGESSEDDELAVS